MTLCRTYRRILWSTPVIARVERNGTRFRKKSLARQVPYGATSGAIRPRSPRFTLTEPWTIIVFVVCDKFEYSKLSDADVFLLLTVFPESSINSASFFLALAASDTAQRVPPSVDTTSDQTSKYLRNLREQNFPHELLLRIERP